MRKSIVKKVVCTLVIAVLIVAITPFIAYGETYEEPNSYYEIISPLGPGVSFPGECCD